MYAFVHIEKNAGTTVINILRRSFGAEHCDIRLPLAKRSADSRDHRVCVDSTDLRRVRRVYRRLKGISGHNVKPYADLHLECPEIRFFTFLRNPAKRFLSHFFNRADGHNLEAFERWVAGGWTHNWQTKMVAGEPNAEKAINLISNRFGFVGLTERFDESLVLLRQSLGGPGLRTEYRRENQLSEKQRPRDIARRHADMSYLDTSSVRARIAEVNAEDQKLYDFVVSNVYPRQVTSYRGDLSLDVHQLQGQNRSADTLREPRIGHLFRNYVYKPLLHCYLV